MPQLQQARWWASRTLAVVGGAALVVAATGMAGGAESLPAAAFSNGTAAATATSMKFNPTAAQLSIGVAFGTSLAGYTNEVAKAESRGIDLGVIGTTLAGQGCDGSDPTIKAADQPNPIVVDSRDPNAAQGKSGPETFYGYPIPTFQKSALATTTPMSEATTVSGPIGQPGLIEIAGARSDAITRVVDNKTREAVATTDIGSLNLFGGIIQLGGLHWSVVQRSGAGQSAPPNFALSTLSVNHVPVAIPAMDPSAGFAAANTVLKNLGIELRPPTVHIEGAKATIDPLVIAVVQNPARDALTGSVLGTLQPVRQSLTDALLTPPLGTCKNGTYITVADVAVGSVTGSGSFSLELGGVTASTGEVTTSHFLGDIPTFNAFDDNAATTVGAADFSSGSSALDLGSSGPLVEGSTTPSARPARRLPVVNGSPIVATKGSRGGRLAAIAAGALLLLALVAEGDRRKMRRAQRMIPVDG